MSEYPEPGAVEMIIQLQKVLGWKFDMEDVLATDFAENVKDESDRATVIIAGIMLDDELQYLIERKLRPSATDKDPLFGDALAPLGTFRNKTLMAVRLGLIPEEFAKALDLVRNIRNYVAHNLFDADFRNDSKRDRVGAIVNVLDINNGLKRISESEELNSPMELDLSARRNFVVCVGFMLASLGHVKVDQVSGGEAASDFWKLHTSESG